MGWDGGRSPGSGRKRDMRRLSFVSVTSSLEGAADRQNCRPLDGRHRSCIRSTNDVLPASLMATAARATMCRYGRRVAVSAHEVSRDALLDRRPARMLSACRSIAVGLVLFGVACAAHRHEGLSELLCTREVLRHGWCGEDPDVLTVRLRIQGSLCALLNAQIQRVERGLEPLGDDFCRQFMNLQSEGAQWMLLDWGSDQDRMSLVYKYSDTIMVEVAFVDEIQSP